MRFDEIVLYCDNHLLVVDKPAGLLSQGDRTGDEDVLTLAKKYLKEKFAKPGRVYVGLVHRLDRPVSGVMVLARTSKAAARLSAQFRGRDVEKIYVALVEGYPDLAGKRTGYLKKSTTGVETASSVDPGARYSELEWDTISRTGRGTLVRIRLMTGRKHQIRHELSRIGHPIVGDRRYGAKTRFEGRNIGLHCCSLTIDHPTREQRMTWTAVPPSSWSSEMPAIHKWMAATGYTSEES